MLPKSVTPSRIEQNLKVIPISEEDMKVLDSMAENGKQQRVNTPLWGHDLVCLPNQYLLKTTLTSLQGFDDWYNKPKDA